MSPDAAQDALQRDAEAVSAKRLSCINGLQLQQLLARPKPLPAQDLRAELLREVCPGIGSPLSSLSPVRCHAVTARQAYVVTQTCTCADESRSAIEMAIKKCIS
jgi:hypothetical protein